MQPHPAKAERLGRGTRQLGLACERSRKRGSGVREHGRADKVQRWRRSPRGEARGGGLDPATVGHHCQQGQADRRGAVTEECGMRLG
jgi:hypothetical protein